MPSASSLSMCSQTAASEICRFACDKSSVLRADIGGAPCVDSGAEELDERGVRVRAVKREDSSAVLLRGVLRRSERVFIVLCASASLGAEKRARPPPAAGLMKSQGAIRGCRR